MPSHCTFPDYFNHRALGIRPRPRLWLARVTGYPKPDHRRTASGRPKAKTPARCSVVLALGRAAAKRFEQEANASLATLQDHTAPCGGHSSCSNAQLPHQTPPSYNAFLLLAMLSISLGHFFFQLHHPIGWHPFAPLSDCSPAHAQASSQLCSRPSNSDSVFFS